MEKFETLVEACEFATTRCNDWRFMTTRERYGKKSIVDMAKISDQESPADEDNFYLVSPGGAVGFCEDEESAIEWWFIPNPNNGESLPEFL